MNKKKISLFLVQSILFLTMLILQISFLSNFNLYIKSFNLILVVLVFLVLLADPIQYFGFALAFGLIFDIYSGIFFGIFMITFLIAVIVLSILSENMFTNRSLYSLLVLGVIASVIYDVIFLLIIGFTYLIGASEIFVTVSLWRFVLFQIINNVILIIIGFWLIDKFSNKFKPTFLRL